MGYPTKIATCCHCGTKAALTLDQGRHELTCASCGAPLRNLKMLPKRQKRTQQAVSHRADVRRFPEADRAQRHKISKPRKVKRQRRWLKDIAEELIDFVEDIFD